jgi:hypothetical protein
MESVRERCGARCRDGHSCRAKVVPGRRRCRLHGGLSTGPRSADGRARIAEANRRRATACVAHVADVVMLSPSTG